MSEKVTPAMDNLEQRINLMILGEEYHQVFKRLKSLCDRIKDAITENPDLFNGELAGVGEMDFSGDNLSRLHWMLHISGARTYGVAPDSIREMHRVLGEENEN